MAKPPPYEESAADYSEAGKHTFTDAKGLQHFSICEDVALSRAQHVDGLVAKLLPQLRQRAQHGLSKSLLMLLPVDQAHLSSNGQLVGFPPGAQPIVIQLEGRYDTTPFWTQDSALLLLKEQLHVALGGDDLGSIQSATSVERPAPPVKSRSSFLGRRSSKAASADAGSSSSSVNKQPASNIRVDVQLDQVNFRSETPYGLYETLRGQGILLDVDVG